MRKIAFVIILFSVVFSCTKRKEFHFTILAGEKSFIDCPVKINIDTLLNGSNEEFEIYEIKETGSFLIHHQLELISDQTHLCFIANGSLEMGESRDFLIKETKRNSLKGSISISNDDEGPELIISDKGEAVLHYRKQDKMPPEGVDELYKRSAYIHPLISPGGEILTRIQPPDHYHHYGIWNPWTKTHIQGREIDYWNLAKGEGTVRAKAVLDYSLGPLFADFIALHEYIDFGVPEGERVTMDEFWEVRYWSMKDNPNRYILDLTSSFRNVLEDTILFDAYRYGGGIGFRASEKWNAKTCTILTSEGEERASADGTKARWCIVEGESGVAQGRSGILFLSHPENREHPEPMRVWPEDVNKGEMFFEFCPIRHKEWVIEPGKDYQLKYRMLVFDGKMSAEEAESYWNGFAGMPKIVLDKSTR
jgi:hypothetical protein